MKKKEKRINRLFLKKKRWSKCKAATKKKGLVPIVEFSQKKKKEDQETIKKTLSTKKKNEENRDLFLSRPPSVAIFSVIIMPFHTTKDLQK